MSTIPRLLHQPALSSLDAYLEIGGGQGLVGARHIGPDDAIAEIADAGLRGRGGAGFPTGAKWRSVASGGGRHHYAVCNAAEGEPGTFKDRALLRANPYAVLEGLLIAAESVGARGAYLAMKPASNPSSLLFVVRLVRSKRPAGSARSPLRSSPAPTSTSSVRKRRCSK